VINRLVLAHTASQNILREYPNIAIKLGVVGNFFSLWLVSLNHFKPNKLLYG
jgi:hypothetical protein